ncbi:hypothetical protein [Sphingomonas solaris]|uniref:Uncharacterized protein n=1 Tax=Alterirhizorhabdus solaris TaxID=2529389 RepID=A0A558R315_9SPHN|nr:hypothetical protein [Sphingomonas solaris]TVV73774.1 hypothetical protein FOY91_11400 [Sphingomonas solaris]
MRNIALEDQLAALDSRGIGPLSWWRTLPCSDFCSESRIVETAVTSIVSVSRLVPSALIGELAALHDEELAPVWNDLAMRFFALDAMSLGLHYEIGGSCAALACRHIDPLGTLLLLKALSEPYISLDPDTRIWVASTWLSERGSLINQTTLSQIDWWQSARGFQSPLLAGEVE